MVVLGGYGTLEELVEVITWNQLGIHLKPVLELLPCSLHRNNSIRVITRWWYLQVGLLNVDGFYDMLLTFFDKQLEEEFFDNSARSIVVSATTASELLDKLEVTFITRVDAPAFFRLLMWLCIAGIHTRFSIRAQAGLGGGQAYTHPWATTQASKLMNGIFSRL